MRAPAWLGVVLALSLALATFAAACGSGHHAGSLGGASTTKDASAGGDGTTSQQAGNDSGGLSLSSPDGGMSALVLAPSNSTLQVMYGQQTPTVAFTATIGGAMVPASFSMSQPQIGSIGGGGVMTPTGQLGGTATITAIYGGQTASTTVTVVLMLVDDGAPADAGADAGGGAGGNGGVGGSGAGGPVSMPTQMVLQGPTTTDPGLAWLYPYNNTVWPQGVLPPLLQWSAGQSYDAMLIQISEKGFQYQGFFSAPATPFVNHPILPTAWNALIYSNEGDPVTVSLTFAANGVAYGPITETWIIANGSLTGTVYYNSYGTSLVQNFCCAMDGSQFGGATLAIKHGATSPVVVAGTNSGSAAAPDQSGCRVCHSVSANGSTLLTQHGDNYAETSQYALTSGNAETVMMPEDYRFAFPALYPDGTFLFSNGALMVGVAPTTPSGLFSVPSGTAIASTGIPAGLLAGTPAFSPDGTHVAFNFFGGPAGADQSSLAAMDFSQSTLTFSNFRVLHTPPGAMADASAGPADVYPAFLPTSNALVFETEVGTTTGALGETAGGVQGQLWWLDLATMTPALLANLNGVGYLPTGPNNHGSDQLLNYEPTVNPVPSGGYAWVVFTSRRMYGNVATIDPYSSDPRGYAYTQFPTPKKLWVAAIDLNATPGTDPSHPAFYLPGQELYAGNSRGYWEVDPCKPNGESCITGSDCCNGYCQELDGGGFVCGSMQPGCSAIGNACTAATDCCGAAQGIACIDGFCAQPAPQ